jgi:hypothetical protein
LGFGGDDEQAASQSRPAQAQDRPITRSG